MASVETRSTKKLDAFDIRETYYKEVHGQRIPVSVLFPRHSQGSSKRPIMVRWHGGGFVTGQRLFEDWIGDWILNLALREDAILIMPDYRLLPEATGLDILEDVHHFIAWLLDPGNLQLHLPDDKTPDLDSILVTGESAGGWLALQCGLHMPDRIAAVIAHYPMIDTRDAWYTQDYEKHIFVPPLPQMDRSVLKNFVVGLKGDEIVTSGIPPARGELFASMLQQGSFGRFFGGDTRLYPLEVLDKVGRAPPTWILHGEQDSVIPVAGTRKYAEALQARHPDAKLHLSYREGDHGFDNEPPATLEEDWVKEGIEFIGEHWPKR